MILTCAESGDLSPLMPLSVKDLIWLSVAQVKIKKEKFEFEKQKIDLDNQKVESLYFLLSDLRVLLLDSNYYERICALKDTKMIRSLKPMDVIELPSQAKRKEEEELEMQKKMANMTTEERQSYVIQQLLAGKTIKN